LRNSRVLEDEDLEIPAAEDELQKCFKIRKHPCEGFKINFRNFPLQNPLKILRFLEDKSWDDSQSHQ
jgi:hypothetical protein